MKSISTPLGSSVIWMKRGQSARQRLMGVCMTDCRETGHAGAFSLASVQKSVCSRSFQAARIKAPWYQP